ncbi:hypothetical protein GGR55DRAFT_68516 [Xylaria sp. FL0064]|nr:hypothetical protein GGR55DRAFT_68516 [Xylaria sp. FL0064]
MSPDMAYAQSNMQDSDELSTLFSRNMTFQQPQPMQQTQPEPSNLRPSEPEPIRYSISQHYHHSAHLVQQDEPISEPQRPSSVPPQTQPTAEQVLTRHGIDPSSLSPQQLDLFKIGDAPQQLRLIQLWQICPPTNLNSMTNSTVAWMSTTVEREEMLAQLHYEKKLAEEEARRDSVMSMDGTPLTPVQTTDGHWMGTAYVEPYMMSGYEMLARREYEESAKQMLDEIMSEPVQKEVHSYRPATDPVYANDWSHQQQVMENQYGAFQQMGDMEL